MIQAGSIWVRVDLSGGGIELNCVGKANGRYRGKRKAKALLASVFDYVFVDTRFLVDNLPGLVGGSNLQPEELAVPPCFAYGADLLNVVVEVRIGAVPCVPQLAAVLPAASSAMGR